MTPRRRHAAGSPPRAATALVVDDTAAVRKQLAAILRDAGVQAREAADGAEAWRSLQDAPVDIILTDVNMPVMDGLKLIALVRNDEARRGTPIVVLSTAAGEEDLRRAEGLGASAYLVKPVEAAQVLRAVRTLLGGVTA